MQIHYTDKNSKILCEKEFNKFWEDRENSIIIELFYSEIMTTYICKCNFITYSFQKLSDLPILITDNINVINLYTLLNIAFDYEDVLFEKQCENCKNISKHNKKTFLARSPKVLFLSLQRIDYYKQRKK